MGFVKRTVTWDGSTTGRSNVFEYYKVADLPTDLINEDYFADSEQFTYDIRNNPDEEWTETSNYAIKKTISTDIERNIYRIGTDLAPVCGMLVAKDNAEWLDGDTWKTAERGIYFLKTDTYVNKKLEYYVGTDYTYEKEITWDGDTTGKETLTIGNTTLYKVSSDNYYSDYNLDLDSVLRRSKTITQVIGGTSTDEDLPILRTDIISSEKSANAVATSTLEFVIAGNNATVDFEAVTYNVPVGVWFMSNGDENRMYISKIKFGTNKEDPGTIMAVKFAVKPHYVTRKAIEDPLFHEDKFVDIITCKNTNQAITLMNTAFLAIFYNNTFYPVDADTVEAQYALVEAGSAPTVDADAYFGWVKIEDYCSPVDVTLAANAEYKKLMKDIAIYNGIIRGTLLYVPDSSITTIAAVNAPGYWFAFNFDKTNAEANVASKYSDEKFYMLLTDGTKTALTNGINVIWIGNTEESLFGNTVCLTGTVALKESASATAVSETVDVAFKNLLNYVELESVTEPTDIPGIVHADVETEYAITYNMAGGSWGTDAGKTKYKASDEKSYYPPIPVLKGAKFLGWTPTNIGAGTKGAFTFTASFDKDPITYNLDGGSWEEGAEVKYSYDSSDLPYTPPTPVKEGYTFSAWTPASIAAGTTGAVSFTASWTQNEE